MADEQNNQIPTEEEIAKLPRWAQVAFAARCARRVQPMFLHAWPDAPQKHVEALDKAITLAEASAAVPASASAAANAAARAAARAAANAAYAATIRRDYALLLALADREDWDDNTPVPPKVFGPMWPEGAPEERPRSVEEETNEPIDYQEQLLVLRFPILPTDGSSDSTRKLAEQIARVIVASNDLHQAHDGEGIELIEGTLIQAPVLVPEPSGTGGE